MITKFEKLAKDMQDGYVALTAEHWTVAGLPVEGQSAVR